MWTKDGQYLPSRYQQGYLQIEIEFALYKDSGIYQCHQDNDVAPAQVFIGGEGVCLLVSFENKVVGVYL